MELSYKLIPQIDFYQHYYTKNFYLDENDVTLLIIINLHLDKKISDNKMFAMFKRYNDGVLLKRKNTYHCNINDKWYHNDSMFFIYLDCYHSLCEKRNLELDVVLKYLNLLLNKNRNYCIDVFYTKFIEPILDNMCKSFLGYTTYNVEILSLLGTKFKDYMTYDEFKDTWQATSGYCCSDCDGCLSQYKQMQYRQYLGYDFKSKISEQLTNYLNTFKKVHKFNKIIEK